jgi:hypothetical protein
MFYIFTVYTEKRKETKPVYRLLPIPYTTFHKELLDSIIGYIKRKDLKENDFLFTFTRRTGYTIIKRWFGFRTHFMRHIRLSHLVSLFSYHPSKLMKYAGWTNIKLTNVYVHQDWRDLAKGYT